MKIGEFMAYFDGFPAKNGFTLMNAGNMDFRFGSKKVVEKNRKKIYDQIGVDESNVVCMKPQHRGTARFVSHKDAKNSPVKADALITTTEGLTLAFTPGDCFPVIITNTGKDFLALIHAGLKPVLNDVVKNTWDEINEELCWINRNVSGKNIELEDIRIAIGPGIRSCHYSPREVLESGDFPMEEIRMPKIAVELMYGQEESLRQIVKREVLVQSMVVEETITTSDFCTYCSENEEDQSLFFSYRRAEEKEEEGQGRFLAWTTL